MNRRLFLALDAMLYTRADIEFQRGMFRARGDVAAWFFDGEGADELRADEPLLGSAQEVVDWNARNLVDALRQHARHENTARWDVVEFKLD